MYCSKCGKKAREDDIFCSRCGSKLVYFEQDLVSKEELIFNPLFAKNNIAEESIKEIDNLPNENTANESAPKLRIDSSEFVWDVHDFMPAEKKKTEDVVVDWQKLDLYEINERAKTTEHKVTYKPEPIIEPKQEEKLENIKNIEAPLTQTIIQEKEEAQSETATRIENTDVQEWFAEKEVIQEPTLVFEKKIAEDNDYILENKFEDLAESSIEEESFKRNNRDRGAEGEKALTIEDIEKDIERASAEIGAEAARINKFYTFNQKNEEFQRLLDKEYDRVNKSRNPENHEEESPIEKENWDNLGVFDPEKHLQEAEKQRNIQIIEQIPERDDSSSNVYVESKTKDIQENVESQTEIQSIFTNEAFPMPDIMDNDTIIKRFDTKELEKDILELEIEKEIARQRREEKSGEQKPEVERRRIPKEPEGQAEQSDRMEIEEVPCVEDVEEDPFEIIFGANREPVELAPTEKEIWSEEQDDDEALDETLEESSLENEWKNESEENGSFENEDKQVEFTCSSTNLEVEEIDGDTQTMDFDLSFFDRNDEDQRKREKAMSFGDKDVYADDYATSQDETGLTFDDFDDDYDEYDDEPSKKGTVLKVVITIAVIILALELGIIGVRQFAPDSALAHKIDNGLSILMEIAHPTAGAHGQNTDLDENDDASLIDENADGSEGDEGNSQDGTKTDGQDSSQPADYGVPFSTEILIQNASAVNKNIKSITADSSIGFDENKKYAIEEISKTLPLATNLWYKDEKGNDVFLDQSVVNTLVDFDSKWIDYVNTKDDSVFSLLKKDSKAYKNCKDFKKAGLVTKEFVSLKIGEIRVSTKGDYYVWAAEEIATTENGKTKQDSFRWVYCLEPTETEMKIIDYTRF